VIRAEGQALLTLSEQLGDPFCEAVQRVLECRGNVIVTGMGKAGLVGQKIAATLASTGTSSHFLHPGDAVHGDLGRVHALDMVLALSFSGETDEVTRLLPSFKAMATPLIAMTGHPGSTLGRAADITLDLGLIREACPLGLAPSTSTTSMLALGDALSLVVSRSRRFNREDFARVHPAGSLGRKLAKVEDVMRPLPDCRTAQPSQVLRDVLVQVGRPGRRTGAIMLIGTDGRLAGLFTDSDLARILERKQDGALDLPIDRVMTRNPTTVPLGSRLLEAIDILAVRKISELPVVDEQGKPVGLIDITDVVVPASGQELVETAAAKPSADWRHRTIRFPDR
jgi:arabinose-5-phosphate isomerase